MSTEDLPPPPSPPAGSSQPIHPHRTRLTIGAFILAAAIAGAIAFAATDTATHINTSTVSRLRLPRAVTPAPSPTPITDVGRAMLPSVITVEAERATDEALGTGWLFDTNGDFVTNAHVVLGELSIRLTDRLDHVHIGIVIGVDPATDIALIRSSDGFAGTPLALEQASLASVPDDVVALASSRATGHVDMTPETVTALHQSVPLQGNASPPADGLPSVYTDMLEMSGPQVFQGNSGGPVVDQQGRVVGIITLADPGGKNAYAIPISRVLTELDTFARRAA